MDNSERTLNLSLGPSPRVQKFKVDSLMTITSFHEIKEQKELSNTADGSVTWYNHFGK